MDANKKFVTYFHLTIDNQETIKVPSNKVWLISKEYNRIANFRTSGIDEDSEKMLYAFKNQYQILTENSIIIIESKNYKQIEIKIFQLNLDLNENINFELDKSLDLLLEEQYGSINKDIDNYYLITSVLFHYYNLCNSQKYLNRFDSEHKKRITACVLTLLHHQINYLPHLDSINEEVEIGIYDSSFIPSLVLHVGIIISSNYNDSQYTEDNIKMAWRGNFKRITQIIDSKSNDLDNNPFSGQCSEFIEVFMSSNIYKDDRKYIGIKEKSWFNNLFN